MKTNQVFKSGGFVPLLLLIISLLGIGCEKAPIIENTSTDVNITGYLDRHPDSFSQFRNIMEISETSGVLQAYGAKTL